MKYLLIILPGDNGKHVKDKRLKRQRNWLRKQARRQAELEAAIARLGTSACSLSCSVPSHSSLMMAMLVR